MGVVLVLLGTLLVLVTLLDAVITTLAAGSGGGPLTHRLGGWTWRALRRLTRPGRSRLLPYSGTIVLMVTVLTWVLLLWGGWLLVFSADEEAVLVATTGEPADLAARVYFAAFVVFTLGIGDLVPGDGAWQVATGLASFLGLFLVTLSITYLVSVVSAAVQRRSLARSVALSGRSGVEVVLLHRDGEQVGSSFASLVQGLETQAITVTQQHLAYPVLHHFYAAEDASDAPRAMAVLDDALLLVDAGLAEQARPPDAVRAHLRRLLEHYAETVGGAGDGEADPPPLPPLERLRAAGLPVVSAAAYEQAAAEHQPRRCELARLVRLNARSWPG